MPLIVKQTGSNIEPIPEGSYPAVCYSVIDLGTQYSERFGKETRKCVITWEIPELRIELDRDGKTVNLPRAISQTYTMSLHEKSNLTKDLTSWRGRAFTADELEGFDLFNVLGVCCYMQIIHAHKDNKVYANVSTIMKLPSNIQPLKPENPIVRYSMLENGTVVPDNVPEWIQELIANSMELKAAKNASMNEDLAAAQAQHGVSEPAPPDDDIPF